MSLLEKLLDLLGIKLLEVKRVKDFKPHILSDNSLSKFINVDKSSKTVILNVAVLPPEERAQVFSTAAEFVNEGEYIVMESKAEELLEEIVLEEGRPENLKLINFYKPKISAHDLEILRASLFVKEVHDDGGHVMQLKQDIITKYGERGKNIVNLCTAGYFTTLIKTLFEELEQEPNFKPSMYQDIFDLIVSQFPFAIFINSAQTKEQVLDQIKRKIEINKKYGIHYLIIHGMTEQNIEKIGEALHELREIFTRNPDTESGKRYIIVTIYF